MNAAAVAAHYGSVSVVTFVAGSQVLGSGGMPPAGYMVAVLALMETPAIIVGLMLARRGDGVQVQSGNGLLHETLLNGSVVLLMGSFIIGLIAGTERVCADRAPVSGYLHGHALPLPASIWGSSPYVACANRGR